MAFVPGFAHDVFISYSHHDNQSVEEDKGWVDDFHRRLQIELGEVLGDKTSIWRDPRMSATAILTDELKKNLRGSAILIAIVSPGYLGSGWCGFELKGFVDGDYRTGDLAVEGQSRAIKVTKRPVDNDAHRDVLPETIGIDLFTTDEASRRSYELETDSKEFHRRLSDLAQDICGLLKHLRRRRTVFLGSASPAMAAEREQVHREMAAQQYRVLSAPADGKPAPEVIKRLMQDSALCIHFVDQEPSEQGTLEREIASQLGVDEIVHDRQTGDASRKSWEGIPDKPRGGRVEYLRDASTGAVKKAAIRKMKHPEERPGGRELRRLYLICERQDNPLLAANRARMLRDHLQQQKGLEVKVPLAEGDVGEFSRDNRNKLRTCDGVLLYWGGSRQGWFEERLIELTQAIGWRKGKAFTASAAYVADPPSAVKENYETREVDELIKQFTDLDLTDERLVRFIDKLESPGDGS